MNNWYDFLLKNLGKIIGGLIGLLVSVILISFGFWKGLFIIFCIGVGAFLGWRLDDSEQLRQFWERLLHRD